MCKYLLTQIFLRLFPKTPLPLFCLSSRICYFFSHEDFPPFSAGFFYLHAGKRDNQACKTLSIMTALEQYIKACFGVTDEEMAILYDLFVPVTIKKGAYFLKTGRQCDKLGFVQSGLLRVFTTVEADREVTQWIASPGYFITDLAGLVLGRHSKKAAFLNS